jgi:hypothetical protein
MHPLHQRFSAAFACRNVEGAGEPFDGATMTGECGWKRCKAQLGLAWSEGAEPVDDHGNNRTAAQPQAKGVVVPRSLEDDVGSAASVDEVN